MSGHHPTYTLAAIIATGGVMGYVRKRSVPSLVAGLVFGSSFAYAGYLLQHGKMTEGHGIAMVSSAVLVCGMGARALRTKATVPTLVTSIGVVSAAYHIKRFTEWRNSE